MRGLGTLINVATVATGGLLGVFLRDRLAERMRATIMQGLGLVTLAVGITGLAPLYDVDAGLRRFIIMIGAIIAGGVVGEALALEDRLERLGDRIRQRFGAGRDGEPVAGHDGEPVAEHDGEHVAGNERSRFVEGFVVASTIFCVGPLTVLGAIQDGLGEDIRLLAIKSGLDGVASIGFASVYGVGVLASLLTLVVYQGGITMGAAIVSPLMTAEVIAELGAVGSLLVIGIGLRLLDVAQIRVVSLLPALIIGPAIAGVVQLLFIQG